MQSGRAPLIISPFNAGRRVLRRSRDTVLFEFYENLVAVRESRSARSPHEQAGATYYFASGPSFLSLAARKEAI